jgi:DNA-binding transcriptional regulator YiaG
MTPEQFKQSREALGYTQQGLADVFGMGANGGRTIRRWESGQCQINPIVAYTVRVMRKGMEIEELRRTHRFQKGHTLSQKPITIRGVEYVSGKAAAEALGVATTTISMAKRRGALDAVGLKRFGRRPHGRSA